MIVPMKKVVLIAQAEDIDAALHSLRRFGVMHLEAAEKIAHDRFEHIAKDLDDVTKSIGIVKAAAFCEKCGKKKCHCAKGNEFQSRMKTDAGAKEIAQNILELSGEILGLTDRANALERKKGELAKWGDFDPDRIRSLEGKEIFCYFYDLPLDELAEIPADVHTHIISRTKKNARVFLIAKGKKISLPFETLALPDKGISQMTEEIGENSEKLREAKGRIKSYVPYVKVLQSSKEELLAEKQYLEAYCGAGKRGALSFVRGFVPADKISALTRLAKKEKWGVLIEEPSADDVIPTLIRNPGWVSIINPVLNFIKTLPGYREFDISFWFLLFFSGFFGILIGDAGYGALFMVGTAYAHIKYTRKIRDKSFFFLMYVLCAATILWGVLTGTVFGQEWIRPFVKPVLPALTSDNVVMNLCFLIGGIHLSIAHLWRFIVFLPRPKAFAELGWLSLIWGGYFLVQLLVLNAALHPMAKPLLIVGTALIVVFTNPQKNITKMIGAGVGDFLMNAINVFTDVISYIRLFAVGLATVAIADAANEMAMQIGFGNLVAGFATALTLFVGHVFNILLAGLGVLVHGIRLNMLEFSRHLGMEWSGVEYRPFRAESINPE